MTGNQDFSHGAFIVKLRLSREDICLLKDVLGPLWNRFSSLYLSSLVKAKQHAASVPAQIETFTQDTVNKGVLERVVHLNINTYLSLYMCSSFIHKQSYKVKSVQCWQQPVFDRKMLCGCVTQH